MLQRGTIVAVVVAMLRMVVGFYGFFVAFGFAERFFWEWLGIETSFSRSRDINGFWASGLIGGLAAGFLAGTWIGGTVLGLFFGIVIPILPGMLDVSSSTTTVGPPLLLTGGFGGALGGVLWQGVWRRLKGLRKVG